MEHRTYQVNGGYGFAISKDGIEFLKKEFSGASGFAPFQTEAEAIAEAESMITILSTPTPPEEIPVEVIPPTQEERLAALEAAMLAMMG